MLALMGGPWFCLESVNSRQFYFKGCVLYYPKEPIQ